MLSAADYAPIIKESQLKLPGRYVAKMILDETPEAAAEVERLAKEKGWEVVDIYGSRKKIGGKEAMLCRPVGDWLKLLQNADYVVTDSFHCVCFSLIFEKQFICVVNPERGISRLDSLLGIFGLRDRLIDSLKGFRPDGRETDYRQIERLLQVERKKHIAIYPTV